VLRAVRDITPGEVTAAINLLTVAGEKRARLPWLVAEKHPTWVQRGLRNADLGSDNGDSQGPNTRVNNRADRRVTAGA
jgi:hypothetical protein